MYCSVHKEWIQIPAALRAWLPLTFEQAAVSTAVFIGSYVAMCFSNHIPFVSIDSVFRRWRRLYAYSIKYNLQDFPSNAPQPYIVTMVPHGVVS
jgi:hypothetical protein